MSFIAHVGDYWMRLHVNARRWSAIVAIGFWKEHV
jgi:hypothetical protein